MRNAYAPHSGFKVGAALRAPSGAVYTGANVENAAYPQSQCAEASAIGALIAAGEREIAAVAVVAEQMDICPPCGGCRQRLSEFARPGHARVPRPARRRAASLHHGRAAAPVVHARAMSWRAAAEVLVDSAGLQPRVGLVLGSGLGPVAEAVEDPIVVAYEDLPGFPQPSVEGSRRARRGRATSAACRWSPSRAAHTSTREVTSIEIRGPVRALKAAGAEILVLTNAAGSLRTDLGPGRLMLIEDHINLTGVNVLSGPNDDELGPRFPSLRDAYDPQLRAALRAADGNRRRARRGRLPRRQRAELRDARPRSAPSTRSARTPSACPPSTRRSWRGTAGCAWSRSRRSPTSPRA